VKSEPCCREWGLASIGERVGPQVGTHSAKCFAILFREEYTLMTARRLLRCKCEAVNAAFAQGSLIMSENQTDGQGPAGSAQALQFFIFGSNISHSLSPRIHNTAFAHLGLPHHYAIHDTKSIDDEVCRMVNEPTFGGASVTFPHKLAVQSLLHSVGDTATMMGAVNTVVVRQTAQGRKLHGENTDWLGIRNCILRHSTNYRAAIVVGAGGAARAAVFAIQSLGLDRVTLVNRSAESASRLAESFPDMEIEIRGSLGGLSSADLIVSCVPADDIGENDIPTDVFDKSGGCVIEMSYRPPVSALMTVARRLEGWQVFGGVDVLKQQAYAQFEMWTGLKAPIDEIEKALQQSK
jgi:shikimate-5-dehydrogenase